MTGMLIIGGSGFIGGRTAQAARAAGQSAACTHGNHPVPEGFPAYRLDIMDEPALIDCLRATQPRAVLHCAVSYAFADEAAQMRVSAESVRVLLRAFRAAQVAPRLVYLSTNAVFSGRHGPYSETDQPDPWDRTDSYRFYGLGRRAGEQIALSEWPDTIVARTANVDGRDAWGQLNPRLVRLIEPLRACQPLPRYVDRVISPTLVDMLAQALVEVADPAFPLPVGTGQVLHLAGASPVTDFTYATLLARKLGVPETLVQPDHYLPAGAAGIYSIGLQVAHTQRLLETRLVTVEEMLDFLLAGLPG